MNREKPRTIMVALRVNKKTLKDFDKVARARKVTRSELIREVLSALLKEGAK